MEVSFPKAQVIEDNSQKHSLVVETVAGGKPRYRTNSKFVKRDAVFDNSVTIEVSDDDFAQLLNIKNN